jgi:hypothetical protein
MNTVRTRVLYTAARILLRRAAGRPISQLWARGDEVLAGTGAAMSDPAFAHARANRPSGFRHRPGHGGRYCRISACCAGAFLKR